MITREEAIKRLYNIQNPNRQSLENLIDEIYDSIVAEDANKKDPWAWVKDEYCAMFKAKNPNKGGKVREATARMKKMFAAFPEMRKEEVIGTVKLYLSQTDSRFIRYPHYFLLKGQGANAIYEFADWYDKYKENEQAGEGRTSKINTMQ